MFRDGGEAGDGGEGASGGGAIGAVGTRLGGNAFVDVFAQVVGGFGGPVAVVGVEVDEGVAVGGSKGLMDVVGGRFRNVDQFIVVVLVEEFEDFGVIDGFGQGSWSGQGECSGHEAGLILGGCSGGLHFGRSFCEVVVWRGGGVERSDHRGVSAGRKGLGGRSQTGCESEGMVLWKGGYPTGKESGGQAVAGFGGIPFWCARYACGCGKDAAQGEYVGLGHVCGNDAGCEVHGRELAGVVVVVSEYDETVMEEVEAAAGGAGGS